MEDVSDVLFVCSGEASRTEESLASTSHGLLREWKASREVSIPITYCLHRCELIGTSNIDKRGDLPVEPTDVVGDALMVMVVVIYIYVNRPPLALMSKDLGDWEVRHGRDSDDCRAL